MVRCEIKLFQNYFSLRRRPFEIILFQRVETCLKLYFGGLAPGLPYSLYVWHLQVSRLKL